MLRELSEQHMEMNIQTSKHERDLKTDSVHIKTIHDRECIPCHVIRTVLPTVHSEKLWIQELNEGMKKKVRL